MQKLWNNSDSDDIPRGSWTSGKIGLSIDLMIFSDQAYDFLKCWSVIETVIFGNENKRDLN